MGSARDSLCDGSHSAISFGSSRTSGEYIYRSRGRSLSTPICRPGDSYGFTLCQNCRRRGYRGCMTGAPDADGRSSAGPGCRSPDAAPAAEVVISARPIRSSRSWPELGGGCHIARIPEPASTPAHLGLVWMSGRHHASEAASLTIARPCVSMRIPAAARAV